VTDFCSGFGLVIHVFLLDISIATGKQCYRALQKPVRQKSVRPHWKGHTVDKARVSFQRA